MPSLEKRPVRAAVCALTSACLPWLESLGISLPPELREALAESDGAVGEHGLGLFWPSERIAEDNLTFRSNPDFRHLYVPFDPLLFCADAFNGDQFAYSICGGVISRADIFVWNHEDDSRTWVAPFLTRYFEWWTSGELKV